MTKKLAAMLGCAGMPKLPKTVAGGQPACFMVHVEPMGKPRMTRCDKWKKRACVVRYRAFADKVRASAPANMVTAPISVSWTAYISMPDSWSAKKKEAMRGQLHQSKPDRDNIDKGILDALWPNDSCIATGIIEKRWDDGKGARIEISCF